MPIYASCVRNKDSGLFEVQYFSGTTVGSFQLVDTADSLVYYNTILANMGSISGSHLLRSCLRFAAYYANPLASGITDPPPNGLRFRLNLIDER